jgi:hypothetical protein
MRQGYPVSVLSMSGILAWADAFHARHGRWPTQRSGTIVPGITWATVNQALRLGYRGLPGGSSLVALIVRKRGIRRRMSPKITVDQVLGWADAFHARYGRWPTQRSGAVDDEPGMKWATVQQALRHGRHGLSGGTSLTRLLRAERGVGRPRRPWQLSVEEVLRLADAYRRRVGKWPTRRSGPVDGTNGMTWAVIDRALRFGRHGLMGNSSLGELLNEKRGAHRRIRTVLTPLQRRLVSELREACQSVK